MLGHYLDESGIVGISEIDTRALTRHIRTHGAKRGVISTVDLDRERLVARARASRSMVGLDLAREVTCERPYEFVPSSERPSAAPHLVPVLRGRSERSVDGGEAPLRVVAYDFGLKRNILRNLSSAGCAVTVVPATTPASEALALKPDGIFLSNGPGDPEPCTYAIEAARRFVDHLPVFGICLGHQILGLACGGRTFKLKFGHRGANHPVKNLETGHVEITSQNHGFCIEPDLFEDPEFVQTHVNLNDGTVEGFRMRDRPVLSVQYHPEASPGPHDSHYLFEEFVSMMQARRGRG
jgi:carbamoyl-phosphate synthase small subunit